MGLDVFLYHYENLEEAQRLEAQYQRESDQIWEQIKVERKYEELSEDEKKQASALCDRAAKKFNLDKYGSVKNCEKIELPSQLHPQHYFKIGYFRSSYNEGGFNSVTSNAGLPDLYNIFPEASIDKYEIVPDWIEARKRCRFALNKFRDFLKSDTAKYHVTFCHHISKVESAKKALEVFAKELGEKKKAGSQLHPYSNKDGNFYLKDPLKVRAVIPGKTASGMFEGVYLIYDDEDNSYDWYFQALEIVNETIEYVLAHPRAGTYALHWSG